jgi:hypothetical protein
VATAALADAVTATGEEGIACLQLREEYAHKIVALRLDPRSERAAVERLDEMVSYQLKFLGAGGHP